MTAEILIGLIMEFLYQEKGCGDFISFDDNNSNSLKYGIFFLLQLAFLIIGRLKINLILKTVLMILIGIIITLMALFTFRRDETKFLIEETWDFAKKILPYLFIEIFFAGILTKLLLENIVTSLLGKNNPLSNFTASILGMFMLFATLTKVPIVQALRELGMAKRPTLTLLMAGIPLSLPSKIVITKLFGRKKVFTYFTLVVIFSAIFGIVL